MIDKFSLCEVDMSGSAKWTCCAGSIFSMKLSKITSKAIKLLLTELVVQCRNILPLAFSALTDRRHLQRTYSARGTGVMQELEKHNLTRITNALAEFLIQF